MSAPSAARSTAQERLKLGFIGLGWIGRKRLDAIASNPGLQIAAIADSDKSRLESVGRSYSQASTSTDLSALLDCELDGVVIATPNANHQEQAIAGLLRGVPVFCQKPLACNAADTARVIEVARGANRLLAVDYCYRHVSGMEQLRERIADGELGEIVAIDLKFHNAYGPDKRWCYDRSLSGGGCLLDLGVHLVDLALWLQEWPSLELTSSRLFAAGREVTGRDSAIEDFALAQFQQRSGALTRIACSWRAHAGRDALIGLEIFGTKGGAAWRNVNGSFYDFELELCKGTRRERLGRYPDEWGARALERWIDRLAQDKRFDREAAGILLGAELIEAIYQA